MSAWLDANREEIALATFALGRFVQYCLDEGMAWKELDVFMQAYLNLTADLDGRGRLSLEALSRIGVVAPAAPTAGRRVWPSWLSAHEKLRRRLLSRRMRPNTSTPCARSESDLPLASNVK